MKRTPSERRWALDQRRFDGFRFKTDLSLTSLDKAGPGVVYWLTATERYT